MMLVTRTHFVIDLSGAVPVAGVLLCVAEKLSYVLDVKVNGWAGRKRCL